MPYIMVDVEANGPCPGLYSMIAVGAVIVDKQGTFSLQFFGQLCPLPEASYQDEALRVCGYTHEETLAFDTPNVVMKAFHTWICENCSTQPRFISDNNGFDWQFINYYFWRFSEKNRYKEPYTSWKYMMNPFGHSSTNLGSLYKGYVKNMFKNFKHLRKTKHTHYPVDDALGNAEAFYAIAQHLKIDLG